MTNSSVFAGTARSLQYNVYQGVWTNWSRGRIMGATLTLDRVYGNLLIAFTATFVGLVATAAWRISCVCFHRIYSTTDPQDALHHQKQAVLRNSPSAASGFWTMFKLAWTWRGGSTQSLARTLPVLVLSALCFCLFTVAAGFSSSISSRVGNELLLDGHGCGMVHTGSTTPETISAVQAHISRTINNAVNYAQECYSSNATGNFDCTNFIKDHLPGTMDDQAACPFQDGTCRSNQSNLLLDSGYLDSREHFGLNTPDSQRIIFRTTMHCAPVNTEGFSTNISTPVNNYTQYFYGPYGGDLNFTWQTEDMNSQYTESDDNELNIVASEMSLSVVSSWIYNKTAFSAFKPDPRIFRPDADLSIIFLSGNGVAFYEPTDDPWYRGSFPWGYIMDGAYTKKGEWGKNKTVYRPDEAASPLGCIEQYQYCNANHQCGELASFHDAMATAAPFFNASLEEIGGYWDISGQTSLQFSWFESIIYASYHLPALIDDLGAASLVSRRNFHLGYLGQIPNDQWKIDVTHWWTTLQAAKQAAFVNVAHGPTDPSLLNNTEFPSDKYIKSLCRNQKIRGTKYTSFSLFGLYFTFTLGVLIILVSYLLEPIFEYLARHRKYAEYKYIEWTGNETLQLQRMAYQGLGSEAWSGYTDSVPKTRPGFFLADLHVEYSVEKHKEIVPAPKENAQTTSSRVPRSHARPNADRPETVTGTDSTVRGNNMRTSSVSNEAATLEAISTTDVSVLEISPRLMAVELGPVEPISPISQVSHLEGSGPAVQSTPHSRP